jgi:antitoxin component HigA of HigAB toxin-antitoxin module
MRKLKFTSFEDYEKENPLSPERQDRVDGMVQEALQNIDNFNMNIARAVKDYKEDNNLTYEDLKVRLGTSKSQAQRIVDGSAGFTTETIFKIGHLIGKSPKIIWE